MKLTINFDRTPNYPGFDLDVDQVRLTKFLNGDRGVNVLFIDDSNNRANGMLPQYFKYIAKNNDNIEIVDINDIIKGIRAAKSSTSVGVVFISYEEVMCGIIAYLTEGYPNKRLIIHGDFCSYRMAHDRTFTHVRFALANMPPLPNNFAIVISNAKYPSFAPFRWLVKLYRWVTRDALERKVRDQLDYCLNADICKMHEDYEKELHDKRKMR